MEFLSSLAGVLATGLFIITFVVQAFSIPSSSMENTLLVGDHVFMNRIQLEGSARCGRRQNEDTARGDVRAGLVIMPGTASRAQLIRC